MSSREETMKQNYDTDTGKNTRLQNSLDSGTEENGRNEENSSMNYAQATLDGSSGKHKIYLLSIIGEVEGHENLSGNTKTTKYDQILPKLAELEDDDSVGGTAGAFKHVWR